jgi:nitrogen regulatory protein P-II 2
MSSHSLKLVTIVTESVLTDSLVTALKKRGATGYTISDVRGEGSRGRRVGEVPGASEILDLLAVEYFPNYAMVAWVSDVVVARGEKYVPR